MAKNVKKVNRIPDAELAVMKVVWAQGKKEIGSAVVIEGLKDTHEWAMTTVLNFMARLVNRGFLGVRKTGKTNIYTVLIDEATYLKHESKSFLENLHNNSFTSLVASLYDGKSISKNDLDELTSFIKEKSGKGS
ncbi:MAG: BlaI/MecI/CopY family transcriptional regulator [Defluviitaleaceae bacterium]|nr:BlaI/MecI/CopY family transcriptional regulator [Defluviitaleaceae bacterium]